MDVGVPFLGLLFWGGLNYWRNMCHCASSGRDPVALYMGEALSSWRSILTSKWSSLDSSLSRFCLFHEIS